jgi:hypothetical protein
MKYFTLLLIALIAMLPEAAVGQITQDINGRVIDADSKEALIGVNVEVLGEAVPMGAVTDDMGYFSIENVPVGRKSLRFSYVGFDDVTLNNLILNSGKALDLQIEMTETNVGLEEAVVKAKDKRQSTNEMVTLSSRRFDAEEAERFAGSRQDPARMAQNFAGVQGTDDSRNDIVIRGNSPLGLLWRYEGIDIFNPSHFAIAGTTGGPISLINNKTIGNSDFMTGAFPAEYGNGTAGVFDIRTRNGNYNNAEYTGQFGLFGTELMAEGPINKEKKSSYMATYRYATFSIFQALGINLGTDATPQYQDASFKLNFPNQKGGFSVFGLGGLSKIDIVFSDDLEPTQEIYGQKDRDQYFRTNMGLIGVSWRRFLKKGESLNFTLAYNAQQILSDHNKIFRDSAVYTDVELWPVSRSIMNHGKTAFHGYFNKKFNAKNRIKIGLMADAYHINYFDSVRNEIDSTWSELFNHQTTPLMARAYVSWQYRINSKTTLQSGLHGMYFTQGNAVALEPRLGITYKPNASSSLALAYGNHSQIQPLYVYYTQFTDSATKTFDMHNTGLDATRSHHIVASFEYLHKSSIRFRTEAYFQHLYNVPVEVIPSSFSLLNQGSGFERFFPDVLENTGTGRNIGIEFTLEKFFSNNYFAMFNASIFDSKYTGSDGVERNTDFNGRFITNALVGYELPFGKNMQNALTFGSTVTWGGGRRYSPIDTLATQQDGARVIILDDQRNTLQFKDYFRWDVRAGIKVNGKKATHEFALDLANVLNTENILKVSYFELPENPGQRDFFFETQLGFLPNFWYKFQF